MIENIDIKKIHDEYLLEYNLLIEEESKWESLAKKSNHENNFASTMNARLAQGKSSALIKVINDLRHILTLPSLGGEYHDFGYVYNVE